MEISVEALCELLLQVAESKDDETAQNVLLAVRRMHHVHLSSTTVESLLGAVADGLGVPIV